MMGAGKFVYFWTCPAPYGKENYDQLEEVTTTMTPKDAKYAMIHLNTKHNQSTITSVLVEDALASVYKKHGLGSEIINIDVTGKEAKDISTDFNISRNSQNSICTKYYTFSRKASATGNLATR